MNIFFKSRWLFGLITGILAVPSYAGTTTIYDNDKVFIYSESDSNTPDSVVYVQDDDYERLAQTLDNLVNDYGLNSADLISAFAAKFPSLTITESVDSKGKKSYTITKKEIKDSLSDDSIFITPMPENPAITSPSPSH